MGQPDDDARAVLDATVPLAVGLLSPAAGAVATVAVPGMRGAFRRAASRRAAERHAEFEEAVFVVLEFGGEDDLRTALEDEDFEEVVLQSYKRVLEALDPEVIPSLARLTAMYRHRRADAFFRAAGRLLQDVSGDELAALRFMLTAASQLKADGLIDLLPWKQEDGRWEVHYSAPGRDPIASGRPTGAAAVLRLLDRCGMTFDEDHSGADLALTNQTKISSARVLDLLTVISPGDVQTYLAQRTQAPTPNKNVVELVDAAGEERRQWEGQIRATIESA